MSDVVSSFDLQIDQVSGYEFRVKFDKAAHPDLHMDEPAPLGKDAAPNPSRILAAAVGNCLSASLLFCLSRNGGKPESIRASVHVELVRNADKRLRIGKIDVTLRPRLGADHAALEKCLPMFEDFCVVTQSVRQGLPVQVKVEPQE
ncbi:MAG TPA: OsmC family protein [Pseudomonadota bacterium]|jgi:organic hydroperoxide reductase OsmC/OhrA|nr:OsmC family protein [Pseudomonadota bacterium]